MTHVQVQASLKDRLRSFVLLDDLSWQGQIAPQERKAFEQFLETLNVRYAVVMTLCMGSATVMWWPVDSLIYASAEELRAMSLLRASLLVTGLCFLGVLKWVSWSHRRIREWFVAIGTLCSIFIGMSLSQLKLGSPWPYGALPLPLFTILMFTRSLLWRAVATFWLASVYPIVYFWLHPENVPTNVILHFSGISILTASMGVFIGQLFYFLARNNFYQKHLLAKRAVELEELDKLKNAFYTQLTDDLKTMNQRLLNQIDEKTKTLQVIARQAEQIREGEKASIAQDLHDHLGQILTGMRFQLELASQHPNEPEKFDKNMKELESLHEALSLGIRDVLTELRPRIVAQSGLAAGARWLVETVQRRHGIPCQLFLGEEELVLTEVQATSCFRILQEALTNTLKHAKATSVQVELTIEDQNLLMIVQDNGMGMSPERQLKTTGLGVIGMVERARSMNGTLHIHSQPQQGTCIEVHVPLDPHLSED